MHATFEQLISLRDQAPTDVDVAAHVNECQRCSKGLDELRDRQAALLDLPLLKPSPQVFEQLQRRLNSPPVRNTNKRLQFGAAVAAIAAVAAMNLMSGSPSTQSPNQTRETVAANESVPALPPQASPGISTQSVGARLVNIGATENDVRQLKQRAESLQRVLVQLKQIDSGSSSPATQDAIDALEARLAVLDYGLTVPGVESSDQQLHRDMLQRRVSTLQSMVGVQHAELARQGYHGFRVMPTSTLPTNLEQEITW